MIRHANNEFDNDDLLIEKGFNLFYVGLLVALLVLIIFIRPSMFGDARWNSNGDLSGDGTFNIVDLFHWLLWIFSTPGDTVIQCFMTSKYLTHFFALSAKSYGAPASVLMSLCYWWLLGGKKMVRFWIIVVALCLYEYIPSLPLRG